MRRARGAGMALAGVLLWALVSSGAAAAGEQAVDFAGGDCSQFVTNLQAEASVVRELGGIPEGFVFSRDAVGKAAVGYRILACPEMIVGGEVRRNVIWSELGVRIVAPDGRLPDHVDFHVVDGHDYYMLFFHTNDPALAAGMRALGAPAAHNPEMSYAANLDGLGGALHAGETVPGEGAYDVELQALTPDTPENPDFDIRGWHAGPRGLVRYTEHRTVVTGRISRIDLHADAGTLLARLLGATDVRTYDALVSFATSSTVELVGPNP